jgi:hypothetical protein
MIESPSSPTLSRARTCSFAAGLLTLLSVSPALAEAPSVQLRPFAPGGIAIDWEHPGNGADSITLEREAPAYTWVFTALVNSFNDLGLQPSQTYRYRVCAWYGQTPDCTPLLAAKTLATPSPYSPPGAPSFTSASSTLNSITVNWTSAPSYSFHQVRWALNGRSDIQNRVNGRTFTAGGLSPGTYHFIVQGCNWTLLGSSCSRFSAPIEVSTKIPNPPAQREVPSSIIYGIGANGELLWYRHDGRSDGTFRWAQGSGKSVGTGWNNFETVFAGGNRDIYALEKASRDIRTGRFIGGHLLWYRHDGWRDGNVAWVGPKTVRNRGDGFTKVFPGGDGVIYAIKPNGDLLWYRHVGRSDGTYRWAQGSGKVVGTGWNGFTSVFSGGNGDIYAVEEVSRDIRTGRQIGGNLRWYRHDGWRDGNVVWVGPKTVGNRWGGLRKVFSGGDGVIYAINPNGDLLWYRHDGRSDGSFRWAQGSGAKVGTGWSGFTQVFATPSCGFGLEDNPC